MLNQSHKATGIAVALAGILALSFGPQTATFAKSAPAKSGVKATTQIVYTCTMHPEVVSLKPGKCPKCGMKLTKRNA